MSNTVPDGWEKSAFEEIADIKRGITYVASELVDEACGAPLYVNMKSFKKDGGYNAEGEKYFGSEYRARDLASRNDLFIANTDVTPACDIIGAPALVPDHKWSRDVLCSHHVSRLEIKGKTSNRFLYYALMTPSVRHFMKSIGRGTTVKMLDADALKKYEMAIPPLREQQKIAAILSSVDDVIEKTRAQIDKLKDLKTGMMQELLTKGIGHTAFKDSPVGRIPEGWDVVYISDVCTHIVDCVNKTAPVVDYVTPFKMIRTTNVRDGRILMEGMRYVTQETFQSWSRRLSLRRGDLIFTREAPVGECGLVDNAEGLFLGQRTMVYRADPKKLDNRFLLSSLLSEYCQGQIEDLSGGSTTPHLRVPDCSKIIVKVPPMEEQKEISSAIHSVSDSIDTKERKVTQLIAVKKSLMQDLLTGKVRVNIDNKENAVA